MKSIRTSSTALAYLVVAALGSGLISQPARAGDWTNSIGVASDNVVHGLKRPGEGPSAQVHLGFVAERGWTTGASLSTVDPGEAPGPRQEINFYAAAYSQLSRDWRIVGQLAHYEFLRDSRPMSYDYTELAATASFRDAVSFTVAIAPRYSYYADGIAARDRTALTYEVGARHPLTRNIELTAGIGHSDLQDLFGASHWYWSSGAELGVRRLKLRVSYVGTDSTARYVFGSRAAGNTWVATLAYHLF